MTNTPAAHPVYVRNLGSTSGFDLRRDALNTLRKNAFKSKTGSRPDRLADLTEDSHIGRDGNENNPMYFAAQDKTHLTEAGYAIVGSVVAAAILPHNASTGSTPFQPASR